MIYFCYLRYKSLFKKNLNTLTSKNNKINFSMVRLSPFSFFLSCFFAVFSDDMIFAVYSFVLFLCLFIALNIN